MAAVTTITEPGGVVADASGPFTHFTVSGLNDRQRAGGLSVKVLSPGSGKLVPLTNSIGQPVAYCQDGVYALDLPAGVTEIHFRNEGHIVKSAPDITIETF